MSRSQQMGRALSRGSAARSLGQSRINMYNPGQQNATSTSRTSGPWGPDGTERHRRRLGNWQYARIASRMAAHVQHRRCATMRPRTARVCNVTREIDAYTLAVDGDGIARSVFSWPVFHAIRSRSSGCGRRATCCALPGPRPRAASDDHRARRTSFASTIRANQFVIAVWDTGESRTPKPPTATHESERPGELPEGIMFHASREGSRCAHGETEGGRGADRAADLLLFRRHDLHRAGADHEQERALSEGELRGLTGVAQDGRCDVG